MSHLLFLCSPLLVCPCTPSLPLPPHYVSPPRLLYLCTFLPHYLYYLLCFHIHLLLHLFYIYVKLHITSVILPMSDDVGNVSKMNLAVLAENLCSPFSEICYLVNRNWHTVAPEESHARTPETVAGASGDIQTGHLVSTSQNHNGLNWRHKWSGGWNPLGDVLHYILLLFLFGGERFCVLRAWLGLKIKLRDPVLISRLLNINSVCFNRTVV